MKQLTLFLSLIIPLAISAQSYAELGLGKGQGSHAAFKLSSGLEFHKVNVEFNFQPTISKFDPLLMVGVKAGYEIAGFVPMLGYYYRFNGRSAKIPIIGWCPGYSVKYSRDWYYAEVSYIEAFQLTGGVHFNISL